MKLLELRLIAFGPFTDQVIDLSAGAEGLHLVFGPNEAGKSSALRAVRQLLFGIDTRNSDDFLHEYKKMRIGGRVRSASGRELDFIRRKGDKRTLLGADGTTALDDGAIGEFLSGASEDEFIRHFGIDREELLRGGEHVAKGEGELGPLLFSVGSSLAAPRQVLEQLNKECEALFKPSGSNPAINRSISELKDAQKLAREKALPSAEWHEHEVAFHEASQRHEALSAELDQARNAVRRLERAQQTAPKLAQLHEARQRRAALGAVRVLADDFRDRWWNTQLAVELANRTVNDAQRDLAEIEAQFECVTVPEDVLSAAGEFEHLEAGIPLVREGVKQRQLFVRKRDQARDQAAVALAELRPDLALDQAGHLRMSKKTKSSLQKKGSQREAVYQNEKKLEAGCVKIAREIEKAEAGARGPGGLFPDLEELDSALNRVQSQGDLETQRDQARRAAKAKDKELAAARGRLELWNGPADEAEQLPLPLDETIGRFADQFHSSETERASALEARQRAEADRDEAALQIERLQLRGEVPTEDDVSAARAVRDRDWQLVRSAWLDEHRKEPSEITDHDLADRFESRTRAVDDVADRLFKDANAAVLLMEARAKREHALRQIEQITARQDELDQQRAALEQSWADVWRPAAITPLPPREMRSWLADRFGPFLKKAQEAREAHVRIDEIDEQIEKAREELLTCLDHMEHERPPGSTALAAIIDLARNTIKRLRSEAAARDRAAQTAKDSRERLAEARKDLERARRDREKWQDDWATELQPLGLPADTAPDEAQDALNLLDDMFKKLDAAQGHQEQIEAIDRDEQGFEERVQTLTVRFAPDLEGQPSLSAAEELLAMFKTAVAARDDRNRLRTQREAKAKQLEVARGSAAAAQDQVGLLLREANRESAAEVSDAIAASDAARAAEREVRDLENQLLDLGAGATLEVIQTEVAEIDRETLPIQIEAARQQVAALEEEKNAALDVLVTARNKLDVMDGKSEAIEAAERAQSTIARLGADAEQYAKLRLAAAVLRAAIERYRQANTGPVLTRASALFAALTRGAFAGLREESDDHDRPVLIGQRANGEAVPINGMSRGTIDQLYLALRLATLETRIAQREPLPLVLDDVLVQFDDDRTAAALGVLAELSQRLQVLMFTHHRHLVELARASVSSHVLFVHELPGRVVGG